MFESRMTHVLQHIDFAAHAAEVFKLLANPQRLQILSMLCERDRTVSELKDHLGVRASMVSQQLRILRLRGMVEGVRQGSFCHYRLACADVRELFDHLESCHLIQNPERSADP